jgi:DNA-binding XRE family transcriptional regulator
LVLVNTNYIENIANVNRFVIINRKGRVVRMKKPKEPWMIEVRKKLESMGIGYNELGKRVGYSGGTIRQIMSGKYSESAKEKICRYLNIGTE